MTPIEIGAVVLHSGYFEQAWNSPKRPRRMTIGDPHVGHFSSVSRVVFTTVMVPSSAFLYSLVLRHSGYPQQARKWPLRPHLLTMFLPHFSQLCSVVASSRFTSRISIFALS